MVCSTKKRGIRATASRMCVRLNAPLHVTEQTRMPCIGGVSKWMAWLDILPSIVFPYGFLPLYLESWRRTWCLHARAQRVVVPWLMNFEYMRMRTQDEQYGQWCRFFVLCDGRFVAFPHAKSRRTCHVRVIGCLSLSVCLSPLVLFDGEGT